MGMLVMLFVFGLIPIVFLYLLFTNPGAIVKFIMGAIGILFVMAVGVGVLVGLFMLIGSPANI